MTMQVLSHTTHFSPVFEVSTEPKSTTNADQHNMMCLLTLTSSKENKTVVDVDREI